MLLLVLQLPRESLCQDRRPTISFITQPEIVTDIGGTVDMKCSVQYAQVRSQRWKGAKVSRIKMPRCLENCFSHKDNFFPSHFKDYPVIWMKLDPVDRNNDLPITTGTTLILHDPR